LIHMHHIQPYMMTIVILIGTHMFIQGCIEGVYEGLAVGYQSRA